MFTVLSSKKTILVEKNSTFIGRVFYIKNLDEVKKIVENLKKEDKKYTHIVYAYRLLNNQFNYSDDGEPKNTAGLPVYNIIEKNNLYFTMITVTRYFGGIKLGASGLVRAYSKCAIETVKNSKIVELVKYSLVNLFIEYHNYKNLLNLLKQFKFKILKEEFTEKVKIYLYIETEGLEKLKKFLNSEILVVREEFLPFNPFS